MTLKEWTDLHKDDLILEDPDTDAVSELVACSPAVVIGL
jgi:hypothetical protein